jgi:glycosyltransferase involved in cell wall biosynthesis
LKIVIVNKSATGGGAAVAATRLYTALSFAGANVNMLVEAPVSEKKPINSLSQGRISRIKALSRFIKERLYFLPFEKNKAIRYAFSPAFSGVNISTHPLIQEADIIHLHWVNQGFLSLKNLHQLFQLNKPVIWTMHDMWPFTGGCHYAGDCNHYINQCGQCAFVKRSHDKDLSFRIHQKKYAIWNKANIYPVSCSQWLGDLAKQSSLLKNKVVNSIPNPIETDLFAPENQKQCRKELGLPLHKKLLLFGAAKVTDPRKGANYFMEAIHILNEKYPELKNQVELVIFGKATEEELQNFPLTTHPMNFISSAQQMVKLYNAADAFVLPSLEDNLPNTVMEALSCGVPVVSFNVGGVPEMVQHKKNGYLATVKNSHELANGLYEILYHPQPDILKENARSFVLKNYSNHIIAEKYMQLYQKALNK